MNRGGGGGCIMKLKIINRQSKMSLTSRKTTLRWTTHAVAHLSDLTKIKQGGVSVPEKTITF